MRKKLSYLKKFSAILLCFVSVLGHIEMVRAEDKIIPTEYDIQRLTEAPTIATEGFIEDTGKYLILMEDDWEQTTVKAPFGATLTFPYVHVIEKSEDNSIRPSRYILDRLKTEYEYTEWDLEEFPEMQLPMEEDYVLHVGNDIGLPIGAYWGIRKISDDPYDPNFAVEHTFGYINKQGERVWAVTKRGRWDRQLHGGKEYWESGVTYVNDELYWEKVITADTQNISPLINERAPDKKMSINKNNTGTISETFLHREVQLGNPYDFLSGINVVGAVTGQLLTLLNEEAVTDKYFTIEHDMKGVSHLIKDGVYTGIGSGDVTSTVTDYEEDATIFTQKVIVSTDGSPGVNIYRAGTKVLYEREWMSNDKSSDEWRQKGLDIEANSTINGTYDLVTKVNYEEAERETVTKDGEKEVVGARIYAQKNKDTSDIGIPVTSMAYIVGNPKESISAESDVKYMRSDSVVPTISRVEFEGEWERMRDHDAKDELSGLNQDSGGIHYRFIKRGEGVEPPTIATLDKENEWESLFNSYELPDEIGEYDLYVYAKDNATNRSEILKLNKKPIIINDKLSAKVRLEKKVAREEGNNTDIFLIHIDEGTTRLGSAALKKNETSEWMSLSMKKNETRTIKVTEVVPMDYAKEYQIYVAANGEEPKLLEGETDEITLKAGDELSITVENTFEHAGYFRDKDAVKNIFESPR